MPETSAPPRRHPLCLWLGALPLLAICLLALLAARGGPAHAATQPAIAVTQEAQDSSGTLAVYKTSATGFAANAAISETMGDGTTIAPAAGHANAAGEMTMWWTLNAATAYCGTLTAKSDLATASVSFWVAVPSDARSGTTCAPSTSSATTPTPATSPAATAVATHAATPRPTAVPTTATTTTGSGGQDNSLVGRVLRHLSVPVLALGGGVLVLIFALIYWLRMRQGTRATNSGARPRVAVDRRLPPDGRGARGWAERPTRHDPLPGAWQNPVFRPGRAEMPRDPMGTPAGRPGPNAPPRYVPGRPAIWPDEPPFGPPSTPPSPSLPGARYGQHPAPPFGPPSGDSKPDINWSRSRPGGLGAARSRPGAPARTLRDSPGNGPGSTPPGPPSFGPPPRRRPNAPDSAWLQDQ